jgi:hypothetical protein
MSVTRLRGSHVGIFDFHFHFFCVFLFLTVIILTR